MKVSFSGAYRIASLIATVDGVPHRETRVPGSDLSDLPDSVRLKIEAEWTPEIVAAYEAMTDAAEPPEPTQAEIDEQQTALIEKQGTIIRALAEALFLVGNDVRELKGRQPATKAQFRNYIKSLLR